MSRPEIESVPTKTFREVVALLKAQRELARLCEEHEGFFKRLRPLVEIHNASLEAAEKVVREKRVSCGPIELYEFAERYTAAAFCAAVGEHEFTRVGGVIGSAPTYAFDAKRFHALIAQGRFSEEVAAKVLTYTARYHVPAAIVLP
jgi:hypothetical protein